MTAKVPSGGTEQWMVIAALDHCGWDGCRSAGAAPTSVVAGTNGAVDVDNSAEPSQSEECQWVRFGLVGVKTER
jgi:hypothetical protein